MNDWYFFSYLSVSVSFIRSKFVFLSPYQLWWLTFFLLFIGAFFVLYFMDFFSDNIPLNSLQPLVINEFYEMIFECWRFFFSTSFHPCLVMIASKIDRYSVLSCAHFFVLVDVCGWEGTWWYWMWLFPFLIWTMFVCQLPNRYRQNARTHHKIISIYINITYKLIWNGFILQHIGMVLTLCCGRLVIHAMKIMW